MRCGRESGIAAPARVVALGGETPYHGVTVVVVHAIAVGRCAAGVIPGRGAALSRAMADFVMSEAVFAAAVYPAPGTACIELAERAQVDRVIRRLDPGCR